MEWHLLQMNDILVDDKKGFKYGLLLGGNNLILLQNDRRGWVEALMPVENGIDEVSHKL